MRRFWLLLSMLLLCAGTVAGTATGAVTDIWVANHSGAVAFSLSTEIEGTPRCNETNRFAFDLRQRGGDAMLKMLLTAKRQGYKVTVEGTNTCISEWKSEDVKHIVVR